MPLAIQRHPKPAETPCGPKRGASPSDSLLVSVRRAADLLGCSKAHVYNLVSAGKLDLVKLGSASRLRMAQLRALAGE